jgi:molybdate transport system substrate-binding protein
MLRRQLLNNLFLFSCLMVVSLARAGDVNIAVANNFLHAAKRLAADFQQDTGHIVHISGGSTGKLYAQIVNGAPFDIFLAANVREPQRLEEQGLGVSGTRFDYAVGRLVLWSSDEQEIDDSVVNLLTGREFNRLAIANPRTAPYGAAAVEVLKHYGISLDQLHGKLVKGENVAQAYQYVASGNADYGLVALSLVKDPSNTIGGRYWMLPEIAYNPIRQQAVLLARAANSEAPIAFLQYLRIAETKDMLHRVYGYAAEK